MATLYNVYKHEAKDYPKAKLFVYALFFAIIIITMILTVLSSNYPS